MLKKTKIAIGTLSMISIPILSIVSCGKQDSKIIEKKIMEKMTTLSANHKNILVFFNDEVTGDAAYELLKKRPDIRDGLDNFTIYKNTVSAQYTNFGFPGLLGGWDYTLKNEDIGTLSDKTNEESIWEAYSKSMNMLSKAGYSQQWHSLQYAANNGWRSDRAVSSELFKKNFPSQKNKEITITNPRQIQNYYKDTLANDSWHDFIKDSLNSAINIEKRFHINETTKPMFKFIGNESTHKNFVSIDEKTGKLNMKATSDEATISAVKQVSDVAKRIKRISQKVWDNTMVIFVSDHGSARSEYGTTNNNSKEMIALNSINSNMPNKWISNDEVGTHGVHLARMNPTLMIKPFKEKNINSKKIRFDDTTLLSNKDIPVIIRNAIQSYNKNFSYELVNKNGTDFPSFREDPLHQTGDRTINLYPVSEDDGDPQYNKKNHTHLNSKIRVTNNIYKRENWEWSDYQKTKWEKMWDPKTP